jgi:hypothetical protein
LPEDEGDETRDLFGAGDEPFWGKWVQSSSFRMFLSLKGLTLHLSSRMCTLELKVQVASFSDFERVIPGIEIVIPGIYLILFRHWHMTLSDVVSTLDYTLLAPYLVSLSISSGPVST